MAARQEESAELIITRGVSNEYRDEKHSGPGCGGQTLARFLKTGVLLT